MATAVVQAQGDLSGVVAIVQPKELNSTSDTSYRLAPPGFEEIGKDIDSWADLVVSFPE